MSDLITVTGVVATDPQQRQAGTLEIVSFRLAATPRRYDPDQRKWVDGETNWFTVSTFRRLASNVLLSIRKGERVVVSGRLRVRDWQAGDKSGTSVEIAADSIGHDLLWGTSTFSRNTVVAQAPEAEGERPDADERSDADAFAAAAAPLNPTLVAVPSGSASDLADAATTPF